MYAMNVLLLLLVSVSTAMAKMDMESDLFAVATSMRFPRLKHVREDDWTEFLHLSPRLKRWEKENNTVEHDPVNMEEHLVHVQPATDKVELTVRYQGIPGLGCRRILTQ